MEETVGTALNSDVDGISGPDDVSRDEMSESEEITAEVSIFDLTITLQLGLGLSSVCIALTTPADDMEVAVVTGHEAKIVSTG